MRTIARLNWPYYAAAAAIIIVATACLVFPTPSAIQLLAAIALAGALYFVFVSLGVSYLIYDRSGLYRWRWLDAILPTNKRERTLLCHCGFDEVSESLRDYLGGGELQVLDHYDAATMTEPSIRRARELFPPVTGTLPARFDQWPVSDHSQDVIFALLAIHELRSEDQRSRWFAEARRTLADGGRIIIAEHTRNAANFLAFGPGFLHFHSRQSWQRCWQNAGLDCIHASTLTPWIDLFVLTRSDIEPPASERAAPSAS